MDISSNLIMSPTFQEMLSQIQMQLEQGRPGLSEQQEILQAELTNLNQARKGWLMSLANPDLPCETRSALELELMETTSRTHQIEAKIVELNSASSQAQAALDPVVVAEKLENLAELLEGNHASAMNVALSQHIDGIYCDKNGKVVVRMTLLGALANPEALIPILSKPDIEQTGTTDLNSNIPGNCSRRRTRRNLGDSFEDDDEGELANDHAVNPFRYATLGDEWFTEDVFQIPERPLSWAAAHSCEVAKYRLQHRASMQATVNHFGKTKPTIQKALQYAKEHFGIDALGRCVSESTRKYWAKDHALEVAQFFRRPGASMKKAEAIFGKSQPTLTKAKRMAAEMELSSVKASD
ncbi:hypothetical protein [Gimesia sp.]|uniref:hypothetical protein n=1 Tax=Gimesia sp. TaxID=2024833 RepID=UPI003A917681